MLTVAVGSRNPVKIQAVEAAFSAIWPELEIRVAGYDVRSGISDQPMSDEESRLGAKNRAAAALAADANAAYGVGLEGGLQEIDGHWTDTQWVVIVNRAGKTGVGQSVRVQVPDKMMELIHGGMELGDVIDQVFGQTNMKQAGGYMNEVTQGVINREQQGFGAVVTALAPFAHPDIFEG